MRKLLVVFFGMLLLGPSLNAEDVDDLDVQPEVRSNDGGCVDEVHLLTDFAHNEWSVVFSSLYDSDTATTANVIPLYKVRAGWIILRTFIGIMDGDRPVLYSMVQACRMGNCLCEPKLFLAEVRTDLSFDDDLYFKQ